MEEMASANYNPNLVKHDVFLCLQISKKTSWQSLSAAFYVHNYVRICMTLNYSYTYITVRGTTLTFLVKFNVQQHHPNQQHLSCMLCYGMSYIYSLIQSTWLLLRSTQLHCPVYTIHELITLLISWHYSAIMFKFEQRLSFGHFGPL